MNKQTKQKKDNMETQKLSDPEELIAQIGRDVSSRLNQYYEQWEGGLSFRNILSNYSVKAKKINLSVTELANILVERGVIKIFLTPSGARFVFPGNCDMPLPKIQEWLQTQDIKRESEKEARRMNND